MEVKSIVTTKQNVFFQTMVTSVSSLLKTVRSVEDEASRGVRAIESTVDAVKQAVLVRIFLLSRKDCLQKA